MSPSCSAWSFSLYACVTHLKHCTSRCSQVSSSLQVLWAHTHNVHSHINETLVLKTWLPPRTHTPTVLDNVLTSLVVPGDNQPHTDSLLHQIGKLIKTTLTQLTLHTVSTVVTIAENKAPVMLGMETRRWFLERFMGKRPMWRCSVCSLWLQKFDAVC